jgi:NAD(P)-dependent dehydrogenase (short-subunit alcohol dehydrogenase family)
METPTKIALITGGNRGLGYEIARQLGNKGMTVLLGARDKMLGTEAAEKLKNAGIEAYFVSLDITEAESIAAAVKRVEDQFGRLDVLINNAARLPVKPEDQHNPSDISRNLLGEYMNINFMAQVAVTNAFLPLIRLSAAGRIVNMSSTIGSVTLASEPLHQNGPKPARLAYASAKAAFNMFTVQLAKELVNTRIKVNAADPGLTQTQADQQRPNSNSVEQGAKPAVWLSCLDDDGPTGCFFTHWLGHVTVNPW